MNLILRTLSPSDENSFGRAVQAFENEPMDFAFDLREGELFRDYLARLKTWQLGVDLPDHFVPNTYFVAVIDGEIVGRLSLRHALYDWNREVHGHIGYCVLPQYRRQGIATEILRQVLPICREMELKRVLLTAHPENIASQKTIESCGGVFERMTKHDRLDPMRRYWIDL